jgi:hypothetical protein
MDPVILFFLLGFIACLVKSDLRIPQSFYNVLSIYLLLSIGIKGGIELYKTDFDKVILPILGTLLLGTVITLVAFLILKKILKFNLDDAAAIAMHYGSVSAVTFAVVTSYMNSKQIPYEEFMTVLLVMLEVPAIAVALIIFNYSRKSKETKFADIFHEIIFGKSMMLLLGGLIIGAFISYSGNKQLNFFFLDLFKGFLAIFMLEMGVVTAERFSDLKKIGIKLIAFGLIMPLISFSIGMFLAKFLHLSMGGAIVLGTMAASASYIAAPTAARISIPNANPTYYLSAALGVTFPFNIILGIPIYTQIVKWFYSI